MQENELILDYDEFSVHYNNETQTFVYTEHETHAQIELELIATLHYDTSAIVNWGAEEDITQHFVETFCCGERVTEHEIIYYWFKEK